MTNFSSPELALGAPGQVGGECGRKSLGLGASRIEACGALGQGPCTGPREPALRMGCTESRATGGPQSQRTPMPHPETHSAWSTGRWAPAAVGARSTAGGHRLQKRGASGPSGLTPGSGKFLSFDRGSSTGAWEPGLGSQRFRTLEAGCGGQQQGPGLSAPPAGVSGPRALQAQDTGGPGPSGSWGPWALAAAGLPCLRPLTHLGHVSPFCPQARLRVRGLCRLENVLS